MQLADEMDSLLALQDKYQTQQGELKTLMAKLENKKMPMRSSCQKHRSRRKTIKRQFQTAGNYPCTGGCGSACQCQHL